MSFLKNVAIGASVLTFVALTPTMMSAISGFLAAYGLALDVVAIAIICWLIGKAFMVLTAQPKTC